MLGNLTSQDSSSSAGSATRLNRQLRRFFLERLHRMVAVRREQGPLLEAGSPDLRLLDKAIYSTFCDCLDLGVGEKARAALRQEETSAASGESLEDSPN